MTNQAERTPSTVISSDAPIHSDSSANLERVRQFLASWDRRPVDVAQIGQFISPEYVDHTRLQSDPSLSDREVLIGLSHALAAGFPDGVHHLSLIELVGPDSVLVYWRFTGTHTGTFFGISPTGRQVDFVGTDLLTLRDEQIVEHRHVEELHKAFAQLGLMG